MTCSAAEDGWGALAPPLPPSLLDAVAGGLGLAAPTPIQRAAWVAANEGGVVGDRGGREDGVGSTAGDDQEAQAALLMIAPTGTGKTLAYFVPALARRAAAGGGFKHAACIVSPTRELAVQLAADARSLLPTNAPVALAIAGADLPEAEELLEAAVVVGTPAEMLKALRDASMVGRQLVAALDAVILDEVRQQLPSPRCMSTRTHPRPA